MLRGAEHLIRRDQPVVLVEAEERYAKGTVGAVFAFFKGLGYRGWFVTPGGLQPIAQFSSAMMQEPCHAMQLDGSSNGSYVNNFIFIPSNEHGDALCRRLDLT